MARRPLPGAAAAAAAAAAIPRVHGPARAVARASRGAHASPCAPGSAAQVITNEVLLPNEQCPHIDQALETCIDGSHWDPMVGECATYTKEWKDLSKSERAAAGDLGLDQNTWMRGVSPSLNYGGSPTTPFSFLGCELYAKGTDSDAAKVAALKNLKDKSIHSVAAAVAAGYTLTEAGKAGFEVKTACNAIVALYGDDGLYSLGMLWNVRREAHRSARPPPLSPPSPPPVPPPRTTPTAPAARRAPRRRRKLRTRVRRRRCRSSAIPSTRGRRRATATCSRGGRT